MVIYYSWKQHTKIYAEILAYILKDKAFALEETDSRGGLGGFLKGGYQSVTKKESSVKAIPDISKEKTLYVCTPIWAANMAPAVRYFLNHADLRGKTVHMLATCANASESEAYRQNLLQALKELDCESGGAYVFTAVRSEDPERDVVEEHIKKIITKEE